MTQKISVISVGDKFTGVASIIVVCCLLSELKATVGFNYWFVNKGVILPSLSQKNQYTLPTFNPLRNRMLETLVPRPEFPKQVYFAQTQKFHLMKLDFTQF